MVSPASKRADKSKMLVQSADKLFTSSPSLLRDRPFYHGRTQQITDLKLTLAYKKTSCSPATRLKFPISSRSDNTRCLYQRNAIIFMRERWEKQSCCITKTQFSNFCTIPNSALYILVSYCSLQM